MKLNEFFSTQGISLFEGIYNEDINNIATCAIPILSKETQHHRKCIKRFSVCKFPLFLNPLFVLIDFIL